MSRRVSITLSPYIMVTGSQHFNGKYSVKKFLFIPPSRFLDSYFFPAFFVINYRFYDLTPPRRLLLIKYAIIYLIFGYKGLFKANFTPFLSFFYSLKLISSLFSDFFVSLRAGNAPQFNWEMAMKDLLLIEEIYQSR